MTLPNANPAPPQNPADAKVKLGDAVSVKFKLNYRKDLVAKRADRSNYEYLKFRMTADGGREHVSGFPYCPVDIKVTTDDQEIDVVYVFDNDPRNPDFIRGGDRWLLEAGYAAESENFPPRGSRRIQRLGEIQIETDVPVQS